MINLTFTLTNPFSNQQWENVKSWSGLVKFVKNKTWEICLYRTSILVGFDFGWTRKCDHAGVDVFFGLLGYTLELHLYDTRHWDYDENRYCVYDESEDH